MATGTITNAKGTTETSVYNPTYCKAYKRDGIAYVYGQSSGSLTLTGDGAWHDLTTLPSSLKPKYNVYGCGASASGAGISFQLLKDSRKLQYVLGSNTSYWNYFLCYVVDE